MELKPPSLSGTTSQTGDNLQRQIAARVTHRWENEQRKKRRAATIGRMKSFAVFMVFCGIAGGGFYMWKTGMLDDCIGMFLPAEEKTSGSGNETIEGGLERIREISAQQTKPKAAQKENRNEAIDRYLAFGESLRAVRIDYWKDAPDRDRPGKSGVPIEFRCVVPDENGVPMFLELKTAPRQPMEITKISASTGAVKLKQQDFDRIVSDEPYLIVREDRAYLSIPKKRRQAALHPVPTGTDGFNPSKVEFGALYGVIRELKIAPPDFRYDVCFVANSSGDIVDVGTVGYGESVTLETVARKVAAHYGTPADETFTKTLAGKGRLKYKSAVNQNK